MKNLIIVSAIALASLTSHASDTMACSHSLNRLVVTSYEIGRIEATYQDKFADQLKALYEKREKFSQEVKECSGVESFYSCDHTKSCDTGAE